MFHVFLELNFMNITILKIYQTSNYRNKSRYEKKNSKLKLVILNKKITF